MRVYHVITRLIVGGAQENTIATVLGLKEKPNCTVGLITGPTSGPEGSLEEIPAAIPGLLQRIPALVRPVHPWKDWIAWRTLVQLFETERPDIVHTHSGKAGILGRLAAAKAKVPLILHTIHGPSFGEFQSKIANQIFLAAERKAGKVTHHFVTVANAMRDQYLKAGIGSPGQYSRIFSGFDLDPFLASRPNPGLRARLGFKPEDVVVGKIARLFKLKGHADLFAVAPKLIEKFPTIKFLLIGDGPCREKFQREIQRLGLTGSFVFAGLIPPAEMPQWLAAMDLLVHLSRREGLPRAVPQAMAAAKPAVAYALDGTPEVCLDGQTGFLVSPGDLETLADRILRLAQSPSLRTQLGREGQTLVRAMFPVQKMVDDLFALYLQLLRA